MRSPGSLARQRPSFARAAIAALSAGLAALGGMGAASAQELGHDAALRMAAERNLSLLVTNLERRRLQLVADTARRPYLPEIGVESAVKETRTRPGQAIETAATATYTSPYGQAVNAAAVIGSGVAGSVESNRTLQIEVAQSILRGGPYPGGAADLQQADLDAKIGREVFKDQLNQLLSRADRAYWDLAIAKEEVEIKRRSRDRAKTQYDETRENIRRGLLAPGEIHIVEENLVGFDDLLNRAEENLLLARSALARMLNLPALAAVGASSPVDAAGVAEPSETEALAAVASKNPSVVAAKLGLERAKVGISADVRAALPKLDVFGRAQYGSGRDEFGTPIVTIDPQVQLFLGLRLSVPLYWGPDLARVQRARVEHAQRSAVLQDTEASALSAVHEAAVRIHARRLRLDLASRLVDLGQKKLDVEREKYKSGLSTLADVVRFQRDLDSAYSNALRAKVDVLTAHTDLLLARGDLYEALHVVVK